MRINTQQMQNNGSRFGKQMNQRPGHRGRGKHHRRGPACRCFRKQLAYALWNKFAKQNCVECDDRYHHSGSQNT